jgi:hypothetical protein
MADYAQMIRNHASERAKREREMGENETDPALADLFESVQVATTEEIADALGVSVAWARDWAKSNVDKLGNTYAWTLPLAERFSEEIEAELGPESEDEEEDPEEEEEEPEEEATEE